MNILFSTTYYHPYVSGLSLYVKRLAQELALHGHTETVLCMQHDPTSAIHETTHAVSVVRAKPLFSVSKGFVSLWFLLHSWRLVQWSDVVVVNLPQAEGWIPALLGKLFGKRVISIYHCEIDLPKGFVNDCIQVCLEIANMASLAFSDTVVTYTKDYAKSSQILRPFLKKTKHIYPPVPAPIVRKSVQTELKKTIGKADIVIGVAARLAEEKGVEYLLDGLKQIQRQKTMSNRQIKIVVAGELDPVGEERYKRKIFRMVKQLKNTVVFLGNLPQQKMGAFYSLLDCLVLPSVNSTESFGMVQVEAMLCGIPVIASDLPGVRVPIKKTGMGILVPPRDSVSIARAIEAIMKNRNLYIRPQKDIESLFSFKKTISLYEHLIVS